MRVVVRRVGTLPPSSSLSRKLSVSRPFSLSLFLSRRALSISSCFPGLFSPTCSSRVGSVCWHVAGWRSWVERTLEPALLCFLLLRHLFFHLLRLFLHLPRQSLAIFLSLSISLPFSFVDRSLRLSTAAQRYSVGSSPSGETPREKPRSRSLLSLAIHADLFTRRAGLSQIISRVQTPPRPRYASPPNRHGTARRVLADISAGFR